MKEENKLKKSESFTLPILSQDAGLIRYLEEIKKFPMLSEEEELELAYRWYEKQDIEAAQKLVTSHLRLVAKIAMQFRGYGLPMIDVISEGNIGLMTAVKKFDPNRGFRLSTYSMWWVKAMIQDYILKSWSMVRMGTSAAHKKLFFNLRKIKSKLTNANQGTLPANHNELIAKELDVSEHDVAEMNLRMTGGDASLNARAYGEDDDVEVIDLVAEPSINPENEVIEQFDYDSRKAKFDRAMLTLNEREQDIIKLRKLSEEPVTLEDLSNKYGVSSERIRQIEEKALEKLQKAVTQVVHEL
ncbi:MAG: RNA polymerase sigma factor RpoH [Rickettsiales bacterium]